VPIVPALVGLIVLGVLEILMKARDVKVEKLLVALTDTTHNLLVDWLPIQSFWDPVNLALANFRICPILCETRGQLKIRIAKSHALIDREGIRDPKVLDEVRVAPAATSVNPPTHSDPMPDRFWEL
jgi:hypothetical protein